MRGGARIGVWRKVQKNVPTVEKVQIALVEFFLQLHMS